MATIEVADIVIVGEVKAVTASKKGDGNYVRFAGPAGDISFLVPSGLPGAELCSQGKRVGVVVDHIPMHNGGCFFRARRVVDPEYLIGVAEVVSGEV